MKLIKFMPKIPNLDINVSTAKSHIPDWYKKSETIFINKNGDETPGLKTCIPFLDGMISGYMLTTTEDIYINNKGNKLEYYVPLGNGVQGGTRFMNERLSGETEFGSKIPRPAGHNNVQFVWANMTGFSVPKGWSVLVSHPLNRFDLPFTTLSGIIDSDKWKAPGNIPFFFKENIEVVIPKGTPVAQLIPIKRESWNHLVIKDYYHKEEFEARKIFTGYYKKKLWQKKSYI